MPVAIESPYWNPLGGAILITSLESATNPSIYLVVHYDRATIDWDGVQLAGEVAAGSLGGQAVSSGLYGQTVNSHEDLMTGNESDRGSIAFTDMSLPALDASGRFSGQTSFSLAGSYDCSSLFAFPGIPPLPTSPTPTCTATGATSGGSFQMNGAQDLVIGGSYATVWSAPSLFTTTMVVGAVAQH